MAIPVLILGKSGSGKSASLRNFKKEDVIVLNVSGKPMPFRSKLNQVNLRGENSMLRYQTIKRAFDKNAEKYKSFVIDDSQYLLAFEMFDRANEKGYNKFTDIAVNFKELLDYIETEVPGDVIVYLLHHVDTDDDGNVKIKTVGKMLDNQITLEGLFTIVIGCENKDGVRQFVAESDGTNPYKTPMEMFESTRLDNDLKMVDSVIREYYGIAQKD